MWRCGGTATRCVAEMDVSKWPFCRHKKSWPVRSGSTSHHVEGPLKRQHESRILRTAAVKLKTATEERRGGEEGAKFQVRGRKKNCKISCSFSPMRNFTHCTVPCAAPRRRGRGRVGPGSTAGLKMLPLKDKRSLISGSATWSIVVHQLHSSTGRDDRDRDRHLSRSFKVAMPMRHRPRPRRGRRWRR